MWCRQGARSCRSVSSKIDVSTICKTVFLRTHSTAERRMASPWGERKQRPTDKKIMTGFITTTVTLQPHRGVDSRSPRRTEVVGPLSISCATLFRCSHAAHVQLIDRIQLLRIAAYFVSKSISINSKPRSYNTRLLCRQVSQAHIKVV